MAEHLTVEELRMKLSEDFPGAVDVLAKAHGTPAPQFMRKVARGEIERAWALDVLWETATGRAAP